MNVFFFIGGLSGGGAERVTCNLANYLYGQGHRVHIITMSNDVPTYELDSNIERITLLREEERKGFFFNAILRFFRFYRILRIHHPDVYIVMLPFTTIMLLQLRAFTKSKIIAAERVDPSTYSPKRQRQLKRLAKKADGWVFQTEEERMWYGNNTGNALVRIIPNAINPDFLKDAYAGERKKTIITAGRLTDQKNHKLLISAYAKVHHIYPDYQLIILGDGPLRNQLIEIAEQNGIKDILSLPGFTTNIGDTIKDASLFVLSSNFEGMPNALMEAMALGLPCISTDCKGGGAKFLIEDGKNGLLTPIGDVESLANGINRMLSDRAFAERCGREAHKICERLAPQKIYSEWENFIKIVINSK